MSVLTTTPLKSAPAAATGVTLTMGTAWVYGTWVEVIAATAAPIAIAGFALSGGAFSNVMWEMEIGVGAAGAEVPVGTLRLFLADATARTVPEGLFLPVPLGGIAAGVRVAVRTRSPTGTGPASLALNYYASFSSDQVTIAAQVLSSAPSGSGTASLAPSATPWANSPWVQLLASAATDSGLLGLVHGAVPSGAEDGVEYDLGTGAAGAETVITTIRNAPVTGRTPHSWLPGIYPILAGTRVAVRMRKAGTNTTAHPVALLYYTNVSAGLTVPDVVGETAAAASTILVAAGLTVGTVTTAVSASPAGTVISQSPAAGAIALPGTAVDLVIAVAPGLAVTIDGVPQRILHESLSIQATVNGRDRLSATLPMPTVAPDVRQEIVVTFDGVRLFAGFIDTATKRAGSSWTDRDDQLLYDITAVDYNTLADWRLVNGPRPEETIKAYLTDLVPFLYGVTLDPAQVDGPLLPTRGQTFQTITQVLDEASTITGYVWNIDYDGQLKMWLPSVEPAPFDVLDSNDEAIGDITVEPIATGYATTVWVLAGDSSQRLITETFIGDGTDLTFPLSHSLISHGGTLTLNGVTENVGVGQAWELDATAVPLAYVLRRAIGGAPAVGAVIAFPYTAQYPLVFKAEDYAAVVALGYPIEQLKLEPTVFDPAQAQALADGYLAQATHPAREIRYQTLRGDMTPGQTQTIAIASRGLSGTFVITDVDTRMQDPLLIRHVTAADPGPLAESWRDVYKLWAQGQGSSAAAYAGTPSVPPEVTPPGASGPPLAHHPTHEPGGTDALTNLSASILTTGTLPDARLSANVALEDVANVFTQPQEISRTNPYLIWRDTSQPADARVFDIVTAGQHLRLRALNDAATTELVASLLLSRAGDAVVARDVYEKGRTVAIGHWIDVPLSAGNFSAVPSGTVAVGASLNQSYALVGRSITYSFALNMTIGGTPTEIRIALPSGVVSAAHMAMPFLASAATGMVLVDAGTSYLSLYRDYGATAWTAGVYWMNGVVTFQIN